MHGQEIVALATFYCGEPLHAETHLDALRRFGDPCGEHIGVQSYTAWQRAFDPLLTPGARNYWKSHNFSELSDGALDCMTTFAGQLPSGQCEIFVGLIAGAPNRVPPEAMAYGHRDARFVLNVLGDGTILPVAPLVSPGRVNSSRKQRAYASAGAYIDFMTEEESSRVAAAARQQLFAVGRAETQI